MPLRIFIYCCLAITFGCDGGATDSRLPSVSEKAASDTEETTDIPKDQYSQSVETTENWYTIFITGHRVGYRHTTKEKILFQGETAIQTTLEEHLQIEREGASNIVKLQMTNIDKQDCTFQQVDFALPTTQQPVRKLATVKRNKLVLSIADSGKVIKEIPWPKEARGPMGIEQSLALKPMQPGEMRSLQIFLPDLEEVAKVELKAIKREELEILSAKRSLLRIAVSLSLRSGASMLSDIWTDEKGSIWKESISIGIQLEYVRSTKEEALKSIRPESFDLLASSFVSLEAPIPDSQNIKRLLLEIATPQGDPAKIFLQTARQRLLRSKGNLAVWEFKAMNAIEHAASTHTKQDGFKASAAAHDVPTPADSNPSELICWKTDAVQKLTSKFSWKGETPLEKSTALEKFVHGYIKTKDYSKAFANAEVVANTKEGDCTEHAVLLIALCRASGLPARAAIGLLYSESHQAFAYHMWTEVWDEESKHWVGLDATLGRGGLGPTHLLMHRSSLDGPAATSMIPILQAMDSCTIRVLSQKELQE